MRRLRINVFDDEPSNLKLFVAIMSARNYEVCAYDRAVACPLDYPGEEQCRQKPCADIILTDDEMPLVTGIDMLREQQRRGCGIDPRNKAVASADLNSRQRKIVAGLGCAVFDKPFRLRDLFAWLDDCEKRVDLTLPLGVVRKDVRHPVEIEMRYATGAEEVHAGIALNVSANGLCLKTNTPLGEDQTIMIKSDLPNACRCASVRWVRKASGAPYIAGFSCC